MIDAQFDNVDLGIANNLAESFPFCEGVLEDTSRNTKLYACVCLQTQGDAVVANFGSKPFSFDITAFRSNLIKEDALLAAQMPLLPATS